MLAEVERDASDGVFGCWEARGGGLAVVSFWLGGFRGGRHGHLLWRWMRGGCEREGKKRRKDNSGCLFICERYERREISYVE